MAICIRMFLLCLQNWRTFTVHFPRDLCVCKHAWMFPKNSTLVQSPKLTSVEKTCPLQTVKMLTSSCQHKIGVQLKAQSLLHLAFVRFWLYNIFANISHMIDSKKILTTTFKEVIPLAFFFFSFYFFHWNLKLSI